jgi:hypothetical protein
VTPLYDGDGVRVKGTAGGVTTGYVGNHFEWTGSTSTMKKYYYAGSTRIAVRTGTADPLWLLGDHLGSTSQTAYYDGTAYTNGWQLYKPWGEKRYPSGDSAIPTTYRYTGQRQDSYINLYWHGARVHLYFALTGVSQVRDSKSVSRKRSRILLRQIQRNRNAQMTVDPPIRP